MAGNIPKPRVAQGSGQAPRLKPKLSTSKRWTFSFRYFRQIEYFGLNKSDNVWFSSLLERLKELCNYELDYFSKHTVLRQNWRYHEIDWDSRNVPIKRADLNWIEKEILDNTDEYVFFQFMVSTANGRVVGFWNETNDVFNIVLLDPLHNIQPSGFYDYKVDDCSPVSCKYSSLLKDIEDVKAQQCQNAECELHKKFKILPTKNNQTNIVHAFVDDSYLPYLDKYPLSKILEMGVQALES